MTPLEQFKSMLEGLGWTQTRLAQELGICQPNISDMLAGRRPVRKLHLLAMETLTFREEVKL